MTYLEIFDHLVQMKRLYPEKMHHEAVFIAGGNLEDIRAIACFEYNDGSIPTMPTHGAFLSEI